jgi:hypothetical protein
MEEATSWADLTENLPELEGDQIQRSIAGTTGRWIERIELTEGDQKENEGEGTFQPLIGKEIRSETVRLGREGREGLGEGLKPSMEGIQGEFQIFKFVPEETSQQAPRRTICLHFKIPFHNQEAEGRARSAERKEEPKDTLRTKFHPKRIRRV